MNNDTEFKCQIIDWRTDSDIVLDDESSEEIDDNIYQIHLFGRTSDRKSVHINVSNFKPYFYVEIPNHWELMQMKRFISKVNDMIEDKNQSHYIKDLINTKIVKKFKFYGFTNNTLFKFIQLTFKNYEAFRAYKNILSYKKIKVSGLTKYPTKFIVYESNIDPLLRFMHIRDLNSCGWIKIDPKKYKHNNSPLANCDINIICKWDCIDHYESTEIVPIIQASFDIECTSCDGAFPQANRPGDKIIQIGTTIKEFGSNDFLLKHIITLNTCSPIEGVKVESYKTEKEVLLAWTRLIKRINPDILYGYNIFGFDYKYMYDRAENICNCISQFSQLSKVKNMECELQIKKLASAALGDNTMYLPDLPGRVSIDIMKVIQRDHNLVSYKLNYVAEHFIKDKKEDVSPSQIFAFQKGSADDRRKIATYCIQDCALLNNLVDKLNILINNIGMANVCSIPLSYIFMRGQGIKVFSLVAKYSRKENYVIPVINISDRINKKRYEKYPNYYHFTKQEKNLVDKEIKDEINIDAKYEGAIVFEPQIGFHKYVSVLDYKSLYPSEMIASNLSQDTLVNDPKYDNLPNIQYKIRSYKDSNGNLIKNKFAKIPGKYGIIPNILLHLLSQRKKYKKLMEKEKDPFQKAVLDGFQLAFKVTCNSVYGQCGASTSPIYCKEIAASTTSGGRERLIFAKEYVEKNHDNAICVYGDTDSVFIDFKINTDGKTEKEILQESIDLGIIYGKKITKAIGEYPHELEYEKTFCPLILMSKKRYVGNLYEEDVNYYKRKSMGDASKRRDYAPIVKTIYNGMVEILLNEKDESKAVKYVLNTVQDMMNGKINHKEFIISKTLRAKYKKRATIAHAVLSDRIAERDPGNAPQANDRIPYIYIECFNKKKIVGENIEDPDYILSQNMNIDYLYYLEHQIMSPICQILDILVENSCNLFSNIIKQEHNNRISKIRMYNNKKQAQKDLSTFFNIKKNENSEISIEIPDTIELKTKIEKKLIKSETKKNLNSYFKKI